MLRTASIRKWPEYGSGAVASGFGFWMYGSMRTSCETFGFDILATLCGLTFVFVPISAFAATTFLLAGRRIHGLILVVVLSGLAGCVVSEVAILRDESVFVAEVSDRRLPYDRERAWPNQMASLIHVPGEGPHATD